MILCNIRFFAFHHNFTEGIILFLFDLIFENIFNYPTLFNWLNLPKVPEVAQDENMSTIHRLLGNLSRISIDGKMNIRRIN